MPNNYLDGVTINGTEYELRDASVPGQIANKANDDGYYENMTVGQAEQLISTVGIEDKVPYNFRTSGGTADIGDREVDTVVGGTVAWNQLVQNGNFADGTTGWGTNNGADRTVSDGVCVITATGSNPILRQNSGVAIPANHVLFGQIIFTPSQNTSSTRCRLIEGTDTSSDFVSFGGGALNANQKYNITSIRKTESAFTDARLNIWGSFTSATVGDTYTVDNIMLIDLTQMFGSTIADYIYSLEQATPGAGVAWFKKLFPKPYYAYDAGTLMHVQTSAHNMTGFNQWDEVWDNGSFNSNTGEPTTSNYVRTKNFIHVIPGQQYYFNKPADIAYVYAYNANKVYIPNAFGGSNPYYILNSSTHVFTVPEGTHYVKFLMNTTYGTTYKNDLCISLRWDGERDGEYEPYSLHSYPLDSDLVLRGIPKLDASNQLYYDGDTYEADGTVTRRFGIVDLGTLTWDKSSIITNGFVATSGMPDDFPVAPNTGAIPNWLNSKGYTVVSNSAMDSAGDKRIAWRVSGSAKGVIVNDSAYSAIYEPFDAAAFKTAMSGVYLVYELANPTTETADPFQTPQIVNDFGTEEYVDAGERDVAIPVGHETHYGSNLRAKLEMLPNSPDGNGDYIVRQTNGINEYVQLVIPAELPTNPSEDGEFLLKATVSNGVTTLSWVTQ